MPVDQERIKWLGRAGELLFKGACNDSGLTPTKPEHDENGWDFLVEMPQNRLPLVLMDEQAAPIKFFCQVKATDDFDDPSKSITVSNFEHLARNPLPTFVMVIDYRGQQAPQSIYLCHFDRKRIGQTLRRIRELQASNDIELHKYRMTFSVSPAESMDTSQKEWLKVEVIKQTGHDMGKYVTEKAALLKTIGFPEHKYAMNFNTTMEIGDVVDALLGLRDLDVTDITVSTTRFGIRLPHETATTGKIKIDAQPNGDCYVIVSSKKARIRSRFAVNVIFPAIPGLDEAHLKFRIFWTFTEFLIDATSVQVEMSFNSKNVAKLSELTSALEFICACMEADATVTFHHKSGRFASININDPITRNLAFTRVLSQLRILRSYLDLCGVRDDISLCIETIYDQEDDLKWMKVAIDKKASELSAPYNDVSMPALQNKTGFYARPIAFDFDTKNFLSFCRWDAKINTKNKLIRISVRKAEVWNYTFTEHEISVLNDLLEGFRNFCNPGTNGCLVFHAFNEELLARKLQERKAELKPTEAPSDETSSLSPTAILPSADTPSDRLPPTVA